jgi:hypothetical protein
VRQGSPATIWATRSGGVEPWRTAASQEGCQFPADDKGKGKDFTPCHFQRIAHRGACGKARVGPQNRRLDQKWTKTWGHDVRVLLSTDGGRGDEPLVGPAVRLRALGRCACARRPTGRGEGSKR